MHFMNVNFLITVMMLTKWFLLTQQVLQRYPTFVCCLLAFPSHDSDDKESHLFLDILRQLLPVA